MLGNAYIAPLNVDNVILILEREFLLMNTTQKFEFIDSTEENDYILDYVQRAVNDTDMPYTDGEVIDRITEFYYSRDFKYRTQHLAELVNLGIDIYQNRMEQGQRVAEQIPLTRTWNELCELISPYLYQPSNPALRRWYQNGSGFFNFIQDQFNDLDLVNDNGDLSMPSDFNDMKLKVVQNAFINAFKRGEFVHYKANQYKEF